MHVFKEAFNYYLNIEKKRFKNEKEFQNWCVSRNLAPLSEIVDQTGIKLGKLQSQRYLADANSKIHREILACCEAGHVSQAQHEYCTEKEIPEGNARYFRGLPLFLSVISRRVPNAKETGAQGHAQEHPEKQESQLHDAT